MERHAGHVRSDRRDAHDLPGSARHVRPRLLPSSSTLAEADSVAARHSEQKLNYRFKHAHLLTEALTHPSKLNASASFQRLEWLGDSILDFLVLGYCWNRCTCSLCLKRENGS